MSDPLSPPLPPWALANPVPAANAATTPTAAATTVRWRILIHAPLLPAKGRRARFRRSVATVKCKVTELLPARYGPVFAHASRGPARPALRRVRCLAHVPVAAEVLANRDQRRDAVPRRRSELLRRARPHVSGGVHAGQRGREALGGDEAPLVQLDRPAQELRVRRQPDEDEDTRGLPGELLAALAVARADPPAGDRPARAARRPRCSCGSRWRGGRAPCPAAVASPFSCALRSTMRTRSANFVRNSPSSRPELPPPITSSSSEPR